MGRLTDMATHYRIVFRIIRKDLPGLLQELEAILSRNRPSRG
jgi:hypothetical protein